MQAQSEEKTISPKPLQRRKSTQERQAQILKELASLLADASMQKASTAELARKVGVSEPALYRHFENKGSMLSALLDFAQLGLAKAAEKGSLESCMRFLGTNPGIARLLCGDGLSGEPQELAARSEAIWADLAKSLAVFDQQKGHAAACWLRGSMSCWLMGSRASQAWELPSSKQAFEIFAPSKL